MSEAARETPTKREREAGHILRVVLALDNGAEEALIMPTADDAKVLWDFFHDADGVYWDTEKEVLIFGNID